MPLTHLVQAVRHAEGAAEHGGEGAGTVIGDIKRRPASRADASITQHMSGRWSRAGLKLDYTRFVRRSHSITP